MALSTPPKPRVAPAPKMSRARDGFTATPALESGDKLTRFGRSARSAVPAM